MSTLEGLRVLDISNVIAGPFAAALLGDFGAEVVKAELPGGGDALRSMPPHKDGKSLLWKAVNRNKRAITLDLRKPAGQDLFRRLLPRFDVLVENYRPGVARRLGIDYETLRQINPRLVYCSISGFGQTGPYADRGGYDLIAQGMSGIMSATGSPDGPPVKVGVPITDLGAGLFGVFGILCALRARRVTGRGQLVDTSLFEAGLALSAWEATEYWYTGQIPRRLGTAHRLNAPYQAFRASDGRFTVGAANSRLWPRFCGILGLDRLLDDARFATVGNRLANQRELEREIEAVTIGQTRTYWLARCEEAGIPAGPIYNVPEALADAHAVARGMVQEYDYPGAGRVKALGNPVKLSRSPARLAKGAPRLGEDNDAVLGELGLDAAEIAALAASGAM